MTPLDKDLQKNKNTLEDFYNISKRVREYLPNVLSGSVDKNGYTIFVSEVANSKKYLRPINKTLYIQDDASFEQSYQMFLQTVFKIKSRNLNFGEDEKNNVNSFLYTIQQSIGAGLDLLVDPNSARKHVGNRFEELIRVIFTDIGISNKRIVLRIPYDTDEGEKIYKCENDLVLSPFEKVVSTPEQLDEKEIVISVKTTSKDRMGKMFIDKILLEKFVKHPQKVIGIFNNDVQRKKNNDISFTLVSGLFMVYTKFLTEIEGVYYLDPPPTAKKEPYRKYMKPFSELITIDIFRLFVS
ncbi:hypothetical protein EZS27_030954 [termite gut metagenome]|uniref:Uncharacterized protein n=1 Tax=termite gut metagenome TaxID=433724 RepID=A0A5J4QDP9_9ZZZZ